MTSLEQVFADVFSLPVSDISEDLSLENVATWDSLSHMLLIGRIEEDFKIQLDGDEIADLRTVGDARRVLKARGVAA